MRDDPTVLGFGANIVRRVENPPSSSSVRKSPKEETRSRSNHVILYFWRKGRIAEMLIRSPFPRSPSFSAPFVILSFRDKLSQTRAAPILFSAGNFSSRPTGEPVFSPLRDIPPSVDCVPSGSISRRSVHARVSAPFLSRLVSGIRREAADVVTNRDA